MQKETEKRASNEVRNGSEKGNHESTAAVPPPATSTRPLACLSGTTENFLVLAVSLRLFWSTSDAADLETASAVDCATVLE